MRTLTQRLGLVLTVLTPPENGAGEFPDRKTSQHFPGKTEFPSGATSKIHVHSVHVHVQLPIKNPKSSEIAIQTVS